MDWRATVIISRAGIVLCITIAVICEAQTAGRIVGRVRDIQGAAIMAAEVTVEDIATAAKYSAFTDISSNYSILQLPPATYDVRISAAGFSPAVFHAVAVGLAETRTINATLSIAATRMEVTVNDTLPAVRSDTAELSFSIDASRLQTWPLPTRNFLQVLTLAPGVNAPLTNNNTIGRNTPNVSVNGSRVTQNSYRINGVDASDISLHVFADVAVPAPESVTEINVATSLYDASVEGSGGSVQVVTRSGTNILHGGVYEYFRNEALNANDANLKGAGLGRPVMRRNVYGLTLGGPLRQNKAFFFGAYQGTREANGATDHSLYKSVLIASGLTDDRSAGTLMNIFKVPSVDPIALKLLNAKLPDGQFLIPTPQTADGLVTGTALSEFNEEQFNSNLDWRIRPQDSAAAKFFFAHAPLFSAISGSNFGTPASLPGFGTQLVIDNRVFSLEEVHTFGPTSVNITRLGYNFVRHAEAPQESIRDSDIAISRSNAGQYPGLPLILLARDQGGASIGTSDITYRGNTPSLSFGDTVALQRGRHTVRVGGELRHSEWRARAGIFSYGEIDFPTFDDFLIGNTGPSQFLNGVSGFSHLGTGLTNRNAITTDYHFFVQDDWRVSPKLTLNLGLRYELDSPPYDSRGRIGGFDPTLYQPRMATDSNGFPVGPPAAGIIEAGNALPQYSLPGVTRVGQHIIKSLDRNNFGPRIGFAWSPLTSGRLALCGGYGIFYARPSFIYLGLEYFAPPFFATSDTSGQPFSNPFATAPPDASFPLLKIGTMVDATVIDRNARTPYIQQFNSSLQYEVSRNSILQIGYVGSRGVKLFRSVGINQAQIASIKHPIVNAVTGQLISTNTVENASLRAPLQGVSPGSFALNQSTAQSTYHSLQTVLSRRMAAGLQFSGSYTFSRSIDNASNPGNGANTDGSLDRSGGLDTGNVWGNQLEPRANRGISDFDRTHSFALECSWNMPTILFARHSAGYWFSGWQVSTIVTAMSGLPVDIFDAAGGSLYGFVNGARPNWSPGANRRTATTSVPAGYYFNPSAFVEATVQPGQPIPSASDPTALAADQGTDIGNVGRNVLRGPAQSNADFSVNKHFQVHESEQLELRADFFNLFNHANRDNPVSDISDPNFGRIRSFNSSPRIVQFALSVTF